MVTIGKDADGVIRYYAFALNPEIGKVAQLLVTRRPGSRPAQEWTGVTYRSNKDAWADMARLNCAGGR